MSNQNSYRSSEMEQHYTMSATQDVEILESGVSGSAMPPVNPAPGSQPAQDAPGFEHCVNIPGYNPETYPGTPLRWGSSGMDVINMQVRLNRVASTYTAINTQTVDGKFGQNMYNAVIRFQRQLGLVPDGVIGSATWNRIVQVDVDCETGGFCPVNPPYPGYVLGRGATGDSVRFIQSYMGAVPGLTAVTIDGVFGQATQSLVRSFQARYNLTVDSLVGSITWASMVNAFNSLN